MITKSITLVITSCNRLHLLKRTIDSFEHFNTYPIKEAIIIEDSGIKSVYEELIQNYGDRFRILFNSTPLKQIPSIDRAYHEVKTDYIFHCEDDWVFYRHGFIEDSLTILESNPKIKQVGLRSIQHDILVNHPTITVSKKPLVIKNIFCYRMDMTEKFKDYDWVTCSFNPSLLRNADYELIGSYQSKAITEGGVSLWYKKQGFFSVILENDAIKHIGWESSTMGHYKSDYIFIVRFKNFLKSAINLMGFNYKYN